MQNIPLQENHDAIDSHSSGKPLLSSVRPHHSVRDTSLSLSIPLIPLFAGFAIFIGVFTSGLFLGYNLGRNSHQNVNTLLQTGFKVYDPDGFEVERFTEDTDFGYFTTEPKD